MALIKCPDCGKMFSEYAEYCPECGCPVEDAVTANKEAELISQQDNELEEHTVSSKDNNSLNEECEVNNNLGENITESLNESPMEYDLYSDDNDSKEKKYLGILAAIVLGGLLIYGLFHYFNKPSFTDNKSEEITELVIDTVDVSESTESNMEQQIIARAEYIFKNLPDHKELDEIDKSVFSSSFLGVLEKASELNEKCEKEGDLSMEGLFYWYYGQDGCSGDGLVGLSLISHDNSIAYVSVKYRNCSIKEHRMKLIFKDGKWLCDNWDKKREELISSIKNVSDNFEKQNSPSESFEYKSEEVTNDEKEEKTIDISQISEKRAIVKEDFEFSASISLVRLSYFYKGKEIYDCFPAKGNVELTFKKFEKGNNLKVKYNIDKFGDHETVRFIDNVRVVRWKGYAGVVYCVYDNNGNEIIVLIPRDKYKGDKTYKCEIFDERIISRDKP